VGTFVPVISATSRIVQPKAWTRTTASRCCSDNAPSAFPRAGSIQGSRHSWRTKTGGSFLCLVRLCPTRNRNPPGLSNFSIRCQCSQAQARASAVASRPRSIPSAAKCALRRPGSTWPTNSSNSFSEGGFIWVPIHSDHRGGQRYDSRFCVRTVEDRRPVEAVVIGPTQTIIGYRRRCPPWAKRATLSANVARGVPDRDGDMIVAWGKWEAPVWLEPPPVDWGRMPPRNIPVGCSLSLSPSLWL
jgi:hypothetical protein